MSKKNYSKSVRAARRQPTAKRNRRGVLLLVVLSMLVMFMMAGVAFVVIAKHYADIGKSVSKTDTVAASQPDNLLESALYDILRDTNNPSSRVRYHSLLRDLYGVDGFVGEVDAPDAGPNFARFAGAVASNNTNDLLGPTDGQMVEFAIDTDNPPEDFSGNPHDLSRIDDYYSGRVLTWISGPMMGQSARIVGYHYDSR